MQDAHDDEWQVDLAGFEGPIDLLLSLARDRKIDLTVISIAALADQYLRYIAEVKEARLEIAAEYLVMAAWLAYLKSRLLLPRDDSSDDGPSAGEMAAILAERMRRLEAIQGVTRQLLSLPRLGRDWHTRGAPEGVASSRSTAWQPDLAGLLRAYASIAAKRTPPPMLTIDPGLLTSVEEALARLEGMVGTLPGWQELASFLPENLKAGIQRRSAIASAFVASLEMAKAGRIRLRQDEVYGPLLLAPAPQRSTGEPQDG